MKFVNNCKVAHQYIKKALYHIFTKHLFLTLAILFFIFSSVYYFASRAPALNTPHQTGRMLTVLVVQTLIALNLLLMIRQVIRMLLAVLKVRLQSVELVEQH